MQMFVYMCVNVHVRASKFTATDLGVNVKLCEMEMTTESTGEILTPCRHGPGSCLHTLLELLLKTHNSLVREARRVSRQEDRSVIHIQSLVQQIQSQIPQVQS